jgi:hypothetical protein
VRTEAPPGLVEASVVTAFRARRSKTGLADFPPRLAVAGLAPACRSEAIGAFGEAEVMVCV